MNSRDKGKRGERDLAKALADALGIPLRRTAQVDGGLSADLVGLPGVHLECKRYESIPVLSWFRGDAGKRPLLLTLIHSERSNEAVVVTQIASLRMLYMAMEKSGVFNYITLPPGTHSVWKFMDQAVRDAKESDIPVVLMREDRGVPVIMCRVADLPALVERVRLSSER